MAGKRVKKKAGDLTQDKKTREVETSTAKKNTVKSQEQKAIKLEKRTLEKADTLPKGKETKKKKKAGT